MNPEPLRRRGGPWRSRNGLILGVCKGIAEHFEISVIWVRMVAVLLALFTTFWPVVILYVVAAVVMKPKPVTPLRTDAEAEFYASFTHSRHMARERLRRFSEHLERRIQRIESIVTGRGYNWDRRLHGG